MKGGYLSLSDSNAGRSHRNMKDGNSELVCDEWRSDDANMWLDRVQIEKPANQRRRCGYQDICNGIPCWQPNLRTSQMHNQARIIECKIKRIKVLVVR